MPSRYEKKVDESYAPSPAIVNYMEKKLRLVEKEENLHQAGEELSEDDKNERRKLNRDKVYILNKLIFPAMANLTIFLEYIESNEELQKVFDDDLEQLFFGVPESGPKTKHPVFGRFVHAATNCNFKKKENIDNFRLALMNIMQTLIFNYMISIASYKMNDTISNTIVGPDFGRACAWTYSFAANVNLKDSVKRKVLF